MNLLNSASLSDPTVNVVPFYHNCVLKILFIVLLYPGSAQLLYVFILL